MEKFFDSETYIFKLLEYEMILTLNYIIHHNAPGISQIDGYNDVKQCTAPGRDRLILTGVKNAHRVFACAVLQWKIIGRAGKRWVGFARY